MNHTWKFRIAKWTILTVAVVTILAIEECRLHHTTQQLLDAQGEVADVRLREAGLQQALAAKPKEVLRNVPQLVTKEVTKVVHDKVLQPVASGNVESGIVRVEVPTTCPSQPTTPIDVALTSQFLVGVALPKVEPWFKVASDVSLSTVNGTRVVHFDESNTKATVVVDKGLLDMVRWKRDYRRFKLLPRAPTYWRTGPVVAVGVPIGFDGKVGNVSGFVGWAAQF